MSIQRYNGSREVRIEADLFDPYASVPPILARVENEILSQIKVRFPGVNIEYQGQQKSSDESVAQIQQLFMIAFAIIIFY